MHAIISLTTTPRRARYIEPVLDSLLGQGLPVYLWLPSRVIRTGQEWDGTPDFFGKVHTEFVDDQGPATKLLPALREFEHVITADDDVIVGPGWAQGLLDWAGELPNAAIAYRGRKMQQRNASYDSSSLIMRPRRPEQVTLLTGVHGAFYRRESFGESIFGEWCNHPTNDDIVFCAHLRRRGVPLYVVPRNCSITQTRQERIDALYALNRGAINDRGMDEVFWGGAE